MLATDDEVENVQLQNLLAVVDQQHVTALHVQVDAVRHVLKTTSKHVTALHVQVDAVGHVLKTTSKHVTATERCIKFDAFA